MTHSYEEFSETQIKILEKYVTNTTNHVFALKNLPEVIKGALFSRYSRSSLGLRTLLLKEFIFNEETSFSALTGMTGDSHSTEEQAEALKKAQSFYDRILDGYGDDSIGELGGAHLAIENVSMIAAKEIEDHRIGGSPLEKSTRYIYFDQKVKGEYLFYKEPVLMTSAFRDLYLEVCQLLFETYSKLIPPLTAKIEQSFPKEAHISSAAYTAALRAKVLDCLRGLLPASALTNLGVFGNGRFFETLIQNLHTHNLTEVQELGKETLQELGQIIPSFVRRAEPSNKYFQSFAKFVEQMKGELKLLAISHTEGLHSETKPGVFLIHQEEDPLSKIAAALLFGFSHASLADLQEYCKKLPEEELFRIIDVCCANRENRRHKSPRALEQVFFTFEIVADFGAFRDLQRHRMMTQQRQLLSCHYGYYIPKEILGTEMEKEYVMAMDCAKKAYDLISQEFPEEAQYVVPMAYHLRWYIHINLRSLQWLCELRSSPAGHPNYRFIAQEITRQVSQACPSLERFFKFVNFEGYDLGRMGQEIRRVEKEEARSFEL